MMPGQTLRTICLNLNQMKRNFVEQAERLAKKNSQREKTSFAPQTLGEIEALKEKNCAN